MGWFSRKPKESPEPAPEAFTVTIGGVEVRGEAGADPYTVSLTMPSTTMGLDVFQLLSHEIADHFLADLTYHSPKSDKLSICTGEGTQLATRGTPDKPRPTFRAVKTFCTEMARRINTPEQLDYAVGEVKKIEQLRHIQSGEFTEAQRMTHAQRQTATQYAHALAYLKKIGMALDSEQAEGLKDAIAQGYVAQRQR